MASNPKAERGVRVRGPERDAGFFEEVVSRADRLGALGWIRADPDAAGTLAHVEGDGGVVDEVAALIAGDGGAIEDVKPEGHEQFAIRGVSAGTFTVRETDRGFTLALEVDGGLRVWSVPKGPSMDPASKRFAIELDHDAGDGEDWDGGDYEQGGRVPWPEAIERGHAVFVLHGERVRGGFALQRTGKGERPRWLLIKRRDEEARPGPDVVAEARD